MAIALLVIGIMLVSSGIKNTQGQLGALVVSDFTGAGSFWAYIVGIFALGAIGYYEPARKVSFLLIVLILLVLFLSNGGFWNELQSALQNPQVAAAQAAPGAPGVNDLTVSAPDTTQAVVNSAAQTAGAPNWLTAPLSQVLPSWLLQVVPK